MSAFRDFLSSPSVGDFVEKRRARREGRQPIRYVPPFAGITVTHDSIQFDRRVYPLAGARAEVESAGAFRTRLSATRIALVGPLALLARKTMDDRELYLLVTTTEGQFVVGIDPRKGLEAREFAATINSLGARDAV